MILTSAQF